MLLAAACDGGGVTASGEPPTALEPAPGIERVVSSGPISDDPEPASPVVEDVPLGEPRLPASTSTSTVAASASPDTGVGTAAATPITSTAPVTPEPTPVPTSEAPAASPTMPEPPAPTTTTSSPPAGPSLPPGAWDAAVAGTSAGARASQASASGIHVGPGQTHATISDAVAASSAGSTIIIHDNGDAYREAFSRDDGWVGKQLRFVAASGERPIVSGADLVGEWTADGGRWFHGYTDDRFEFPLPTEGNIIPHQISGSSPNAGLLEQVVLDGQPLRQVASLTDLAAGSFFVDRAADRVYIADDPAGRTVEITSRHRALMFAAGASGSTVEGITITGFSPRHLDGTAMVVLDGATDVMLRDVVLSRSSATGLVAVDADRLVLDQVSMIQNGARGMSGDRLDDLVIRRSRFEANNAERFDAGGCGGGTFCVLAGAKLTRSTGIAVSFSDFSDNRATGFWCDLECRDLVFVANHAADNARHGVYFEVSEGAVIEANIVARNGESGVKTSGSRMVRIAHNTFVANGAHVNVGADYRPSSIGFHTSPETHMGAIDLVDNAFAETTARLAVVDPVNHDAAPGPWSRLGVVANNLYLLTDADAGSDWRFRAADGRFELDPSAVVSPAAVEIGDPMAWFSGGFGDLRLVGAPAALETAPMSSAAAAFFPALGALPPGAPLG